MFLIVRNCISMSIEGWVGCGLYTFHYLFIYLLSVRKAFLFVNDVPERGGGHKCQHPF